MERNVEAPLKEALSFSEADRAEISGALLESLEPAPEAEVEKARRREVAARVAALDAGKVATVPCEEVRDRLRSPSSLTTSSIERRETALK